ncbi:hypothetical protein DL764_002862 [Monosporascus ibericus]|uniref:Uncharacterized protein n=1 Tax=Monosporascus ibericus TaxID=155417 RepID=A0A4Q4TLA4_9PEZI|nr:hypothetical protein DL764_002862 [Monosporascus ibericus]
MISTHLVTRKMGLSRDLVPFSLDSQKSRRAFTEHVGAGNYQFRSARRYIMDDAVLLCSTGQEHIRQPPVSTVGVEMHETTNPGRHQASSSPYHLVLPSLRIGHHVPTAVCFVLRTGHALALTAVGLIAPDCSALPRRAVDHPWDGAEAAEAMGKRIQKRPIPASVSGRPPGPTNPGGNPDNPGGPEPTAGLEAGPRPSPPAEPDPSQNRVQCYHEGHPAERETLVVAAFSACSLWRRRTLRSGDFGTLTSQFGWDPVHEAGLNIVASIDVRENCQWTADLNKCQDQFMQIIDSCDTTTTADKRGGTMSNNCIQWRIDPQHNQDIEPPFTPEPEPDPEPESEPDRPVRPSRATHWPPVYHIWTWVLSRPNQGGVWLPPAYGTLGVAFSVEKYLVCGISGGWNVDLEENEMLEQMASITGVFGDTCNYRSETNFEDTVVESRVG